MKSIAELKKELQEKITPDNIVEAIIYKANETLKKTEYNTMPKHGAFLQTVFYNMKKEMPDLFSGFIFDESGINPFSDELDSILFCLETSTILPTLNPSYKNYSIINSHEEILEASYKKLEERKEEIDKCAEILSEMVKKQVK